MLGIVYQSKLFIIHYHFDQFLFVKCFSASLEHFKKVEKRENLCIAVSSLVCRNEKNRSKMMSVPFRIKGGRGRKGGKVGCLSFVPSKNFLIDLFLVKESGIVFLVASFLFPISIPCTHWNGSCYIIMR